MSDIEARLRQALRAEAATVDPDDQGGLETVARRGRAARQRRRLAVAGATLAIVVAAGIAVVPNLGGDDERVETPAGEVTTTTTGATTTSTTVVTASPDQAALEAALFPLPGDTAAHTTDPGRAAAGFLEAYFDDQVGVERLSAFREGEPGAGEIDVFRVGESGQVLSHVVSTLSLRRLDREHWFVVAASSDDVVLDDPEPLATVATPLAAAGRGRGFEGTVVVDVRARSAGQLGVTLGEAAVIAGCCEALEPYAALVDFGRPPATLGAVVAHNDSGIAAVDAFTVIPVRFGEAADVTSFQVFFHRGDGPVVAVNRTVPRTQGVLRAALVALLEGPTAAERADGITSQFSGAPAGSLLDVRIDAGVATVDLTPTLVDVLVNASTSARSAVLLAELDATVFQFPAVTSARYRLGQSCERFAAWLQLADCERDRP